MSHEHVIIRGFLLHLRNNQVHLRHDFSTPLDDREITELIHDFVDPKPTTPSPDPVGQKTEQQTQNTTPK